MKNKARVVRKEFTLRYDFEKDMDEYIEYMYNDPNIEVLAMNIVHQRTRFSENGVYWVIFVVRDA